MNKNPSDSFQYLFQKKWETRSSLRTRPRKVIDFNRPGYFSPPEKQALLLIPEVDELDDSKKVKILLHTFYKHLNDIINLEVKWSHVACSHIVEGKTVVRYLEMMKLNAYTVMMDEYYHVYMAQDMAIQLTEHYSSLMRFNYPRPDADIAMSIIKNKLSEEFHAVFEVIAVCIFETTVVRELIEYFDSPNIHPAVKYYIKDHMNDESRHYGYFAEVLSYTWDNISDNYKQAIGCVLPEFISLYLNVSSEKNFNQSLLTMLDFPSEQSERIVKQLYEGFSLSPEAPMVKQVLRVLSKANILDSKYAKPFFDAEGFLG